MYNLLIPIPLFNFVGVVDFSPALCKKQPDESIVLICFFFFFIVIPLILCLAKGSLLSITSLGWSRILSRDCVTKLGGVS